MEDTMKRIREMAQKHQEILGVGHLPLPEFKVSQRTGARYGGTCKYWRNTQRVLVTVQRAMAADPVALERVIAHEMCHAVLWKLHGWTARLFGHGPMFKALAAKLNAVLGDNFVSITCDEYDQPLPRPITLMLWRSPAHKKIRISWFMRETPTVRRMMASCLAVAGSEVRVVETTENRWTSFPRTGTRYHASVADSHVAEIDALWNQGECIVPPSA
jgi:predicted SprT family Zn-dependent metalloprotease